VKIHPIENHGCRYVEGSDSEQFLQREQDAVELVGLCGEYSVNRLLLYAANVPESFFDLKSGLAGAILQKFVNYNLKVALVVQADQFRGKFKEFVLEANRGRHFHAFSERNEAELWLTSD
jgi:hypothetical protein